MSLPRVLTRIRNVIIKTFDTTAGVYRKVSVADSSGGSTDTYSLVTTYPCKITIYPIRTLEREASERVQSIRYWQFAFPYDAVVLPTDRLVTPDDRTFEVNGTGHDSTNIVLLVTALEII